MTMFDEIKSSFRHGTMVTRLIYINIGLFVGIGLLYVGFRIFTPGSTLDDLKGIFNQKIMQYLMLSADPIKLITRPWTIITYMFAHQNVWHILFNLLWLYWFGKIFLQYLTEKQLLSTYLLGGLAGAVLYLLVLNLMPWLSDYLSPYMLGASAAIMAIVFAISFYVPDFTLYLLFFGPVKLKYIALFSIILDILMIASYNAGGHIAHLGGALYGFIFIMQYRKGRDIGKWLNNFIDDLVTLFRPRRRLNITYRKRNRIMDDMEYNSKKAADQKEIDRILDKIAQSGYDNLTRKEKETLFRMSKRK
ncbi:MAG: rhomboid family intramembrane serine protease [Bacteroidales bacterium]|nr:rhomboid family intramembrane serine protease [Bacteroidales bacterium]MBN2762599.1 rhomboid family intramembrane serine protease [Bacteroidales bacterium]